MAPRSEKYGKPRNTRDLSTFFYPTNYCYETHLSMVQKLDAEVLFFPRVGRYLPSEVEAYIVSRYGSIISLARWIKDSESREKRKRGESKDDAAMQFKVTLKDVCSTEIAGCSPDILPGKDLVKFLQVKFDSKEVLFMEQISAKVMKSQMHPHGFAAWETATDAEVSAWHRALLPQFQMMDREIHDLIHNGPSNPLEVGGLRHRALMECGLTIRSCLALNRFWKQGLFLDSSHGAKLYRAMKIGFAAAPKAKWQENWEMARKKCWKEVEADIQSRTVDSEKGRGLKRNRPTELDEEVAVTSKRRREAVIPSGSESIQQFTFDRDPLQEHISYMPSSPAALTGYSVHHALGIINAIATPPPAVSSKDSFPSHTSYSNLSHQTVNPRYPASLQHGSDLATAPPAAANPFGIANYGKFTDDWNFRTGWTRIDNNSSVSENSEAVTLPNQLPERPILPLPHVPYQLGRDPGPISKVELMLLYKAVFDYHELPHPTREQASQHAIIWERVGWYPVPDNEELAKV
ncbi:hypothetical protein BJ508DRAFT_312989 [Ascobolus immersus RN42]|uniref:Uncharacterized protein n=1 Tax=Ascobolus immersus RN42 TaxID=1160509 RepID=A0A3N4HMZ5_ASCIM|nr:hypothetical protein BJ508DRAFT_312989 [Ascobolus immersus RN42]